MKTRFLMCTHKDLRVDDISLMDRDLMREFPNEAFLKGYCEGYGFGKLSIVSPSDIEVLSRQGMLNDKYLFAVTIKLEGAEDE